MVVDYVVLVADPVSCCCLFCFSFFVLFCGFFLFLLCSVSAIFLEALVTLKGIRTLLIMIFKDCFKSRTQPHGFHPFKIIMMLVILEKGMMILSFILMEMMVSKGMIGRIRFRFYNTLCVSVCTGNEAQQLKIKNHHSRNQKNRRYATYNIKYQIPNRYILQIRHKKRITQIKIITSCTYIYNYQLPWRPW